MVENSAITAVRCESLNNDVLVATRGDDKIENYYTVHALRWPCKNLTGVFHSAAMKIVSIEMAVRGRWLCRQFVIQLTRAGCGKNPAH